MANKPALYTLVVLFRDAVDKNESFEALLKQSGPLLGKYTRMLGDIGAYNDLAWALYGALMKMPIHEPNFRHNKYILGYIKAAIRNASIKIWKQEEKHSGGIPLCGVADPTDGLDPFWHSELLNGLKAILTKREFEVARLLGEGYSETEIAQTLRVSRKAISNRVKKIRGKVLESGLDGNKG